MTTSKAFGIVPPEPPRIATLENLAPKFRAVVEAVLADIPEAVLFESYRSPERSDWLYGMGRDYSDGRANGGTVTRAAAGHSWHNFGVAGDLIHRTLQWDAPAEWWARLGRSIILHGGIWGGAWRVADLPHAQLAGLRVSPDNDIREMLNEGSLEAAWAELGAL